MFDKMINFLLGSADKLRGLDVKTQAEITKYNNQQIKKTAVVCFALGIAVTLLIQSI